LPDATELVYGTCVALGQAAALMRGPSGCGKSDLALRFLFLARRGPAARHRPALVADDQVRLYRVGGRLLAAPPDTIAGKLEVRGIGIVHVRAIAEADLRLVVDLVTQTEVERLPNGSATTRFCGIDIPVIRLAAREPSAPIKLALALAQAAQDCRGGALA
jgi:HPr kinase/phosphorylase